MSKLPPLVMPDIERTLDEEVHFNPYGMWWYSLEDTVEGDEDGEE